MKIFSKNKQVCVKSTKVVEWYTKFVGDSYCGLLCVRTDQGEVILAKYNTINEANTSLMKLLDATNTPKLKEYIVE